MPRLSTTAEVTDMRFGFVARISLSTRLALLGALLIASTGAAGLGVTLWHVRAEMARQAQNSLKVNLALAWDLLRADGAELRLDGDRLLAGERLVNGDAAIVDKVRSIAGGNATIFV